MFHYLLSVVFVFVLYSPTLAQFSIDSPTPGSVQSGAVAPPNGWKCPRNGEITARVDSGPPISFVEDLSRGDTAATCGNSGNNGFFTVPWNWNIFGDGQHTIEFFDANVKFTEVTFTVATFGTEFLFGAAGQCTIQDFPDPGGDITVSWDPAIQNFRITDTTAQASPPPPLPPPPTGGLNALLGRWLFSFTIIDTFTEIYDLQAVVTVDGTQVISGEDELGGTVVAARIEDLSLGLGLPYEFFLIDPGLILCDTYFFNQTTPDRLEGIHMSLFTDASGECGEILGDQDPMTASRLSSSAAQGKASLALHIAKQETILSEKQGEAARSETSDIQALVSQLQHLANP